MAISNMRRIRLLLLSAAATAAASTVHAQVTGPQAAPAIQTTYSFSSASEGTAPSNQAGAAAADAGSASPPPSRGIEDIVVTAEKRSTSLQRTPISVTALSGDILQKSQIRTLIDIQALVPNMKMGENDGYAQITIRGIGISGFVPTAEGAVAVNLNEVYVSRPIAQLASLYDLSSLEVLRGPQGTLYGRNATAGSVNITTARPTDAWSGYGRVGVGNYAAIHAEAAVGGPIIKDRLLVRISGFVDKHDGYGKNLVTGNDVSDKDAHGIRGTLVFKPTVTITATVIGEYFKENDNGAALHYFGAAGLTGLPGAIGVPPLFVQQGGFAAPDLQDVANPRDSKFKLRTTAVTGILEWSNGPFSVKSVTGYRDQNSLTLTPLDGGSRGNGFYLAGEPAHQFSEELQLHYDTSRFHATAGLYYFREKDSSIPGVAAFTNTALNRAFGIPASPSEYLVNFVQIGGTIRTTAKAAFAQATYEIIDNLSLTAGIRVSHERKDAVLYNSFSLFDPYLGDATPQAPATVQPARTFKSTTPKLGIQYQVTPQTLIYGSYSKGFKSGGYDVTTISPAFQPEKLTDYEGGIKTAFMDNRLRVNLAGFYYDYTNLQVLQIEGPVVVTRNAASARIWGVEAEVTALPTPELAIDASASYLHARYRSYSGPDGSQPLLPAVDFSGNHLNNAPDFTAHLGATYTWRLAKGSLALRAEGDYSTRFYFTPININLLSQAPFAKANAFLTYTSDRDWHVTAFIRNITDKDTRISGVVNTPILGTPAQGAVAPPRTFGIEVGYTF
ncbi:MAG TPA: TonB-dependent receptor [Sphingobium sp.]|uniref:TonB-dependent receptor n=1 Tax=Sphingobium sp. TaxID=1912891 RepID=UPI002ED18DE9